MLDPKPSLKKKMLEKLLVFHFRNQRVKLDTYHMAASIGCIPGSNASEDS